MKTHARFSSTSLESRHQPTDRYLNDRLPLREADPSVQSETSPNPSGAFNANSNGCLWDDDGDQGEEKHSEIAAEQLRNNVLDVIVTGAVDWLTMQPRSTSEIDAMLSVLPFWSRGGKRLNNKYVNVLLQRVGAINDEDLQSYEDCRLPDVYIPSSCLEDFGSEYQEYNEREWQGGTRQDDSCEICEQ